MIFFTQDRTGSYYCGVSDTNSPQISRYLLDILINFTSAIAWVISIPLISKSLSLFCSFLVNISRTQLPLVLQLPPCSTTFPLCDKENLRVIYIYSLFIVEYAFIFSCWLQLGVIFCLNDLPLAEDPGKYYYYYYDWSHKLHRTDHESGTDSRRKSIAETKIQRGIFQGDALSPLLFIIAMMPLNHILRKCTAGYKLSRSQE